MERRTAAGVAVTMAGAMLARCMSFAAQIIVGLYLSDSEIGVFAIAMGIVGITGIFRAGGTHFYLPTLKGEEYETQAGPYFWLGLLCGSVGSLLTWAVAIPAGSWYGSETLPATLFVMGLQLLILSVGQHPRAKMQSDLRFRDLAVLDVTLATSRLIATFLMATTGWGPLALAVPVCIATFIEMVYCGIASRIGIGAFRWKPGSFRSTAHSMRWVVLLGLLATITLQADYFVGSLFISVSALGLYYFAYQFASQPAMLMTHNLQGVFVPAIARLRDDPASLQRTARIIFSASMIFVPLVAMGVAAVFPSLESIIWAGKWESAAVPVYFLSIGLVFSTVLAIMAGPLMGSKDFKKVVYIDSWRATSVALGAFIGGCYAMGKNLSDEKAAISVAAGVGVCTGLVSAAKLTRVMRKYGIWRKESIRDMVYGIALASLVGIGAASISGSVIKSILPNWNDPRATGLAEFLLTATIYTTLMLATLRIACESLLRSTVSVLPARAQPIADRLLRL